jgi:hypothetical protein
MQRKSAASGASPGSGVSPVKRFLPVLVAIPLLVACGSATKRTDAAPSTPSNLELYSSLLAASPSLATDSGSLTTTSGAGTPAPSVTSINPFPCGPTRDVIIRTISPNLPPSATEVGDYDLQDCSMTIDDLSNTSPTTDGYCTQAAYADDNPGYNIDETPAPTLRKLVAQFGPAC